MTMRVVATIGLALAASACGAPEPANITNVADNVTHLDPGPTLGGVVLDAPIRARGTAPAWTIDVAPGSILFTDTARAGATPTDFYPVSPELLDGKAVFPTQTPAGERVTIAFTARPCGSGQPLTAEVTIGKRVLRGCAGPAPAELPGPGNATAPDNAGR